MHGGSLDNESIHRILRGIELYKENLAPLVILFGPSRADEPEPTEAEVRSRLAQLMGIPREAIIKEETARTTREESVRIGAVVKTHGIKKILLVTESLHLRRAKLVFEQQGLEVLPVPSDDNPRAAVSPGDRLWLTVRVLQESAALTYYRLMGFV